ncbi:SIMPL domain-containing protein [Sphingomonas sp. NPDC092331]|jgi:uncharacterized protein|uniref:SIMPL domain-containing protein n=1 Tax=unclassified Sphingomonas TaxID=196159 RepID=UPI0029F1777B|nr:SIMPL domain-containing protein [Pseudomonadota bacterium]
MRSLMLGAGVVLGMMVGQGAAAQDREPDTIQVIATGTVETAPEIATITYHVRGEGVKPDDASRALVASKAGIEKALAGLAGVKLDIRTGDLDIAEVRGKECRNDDRFDAPRLSAGPCAVQGYVADMEVTVTAMPADKAGTLTGLAAREGASGVKLESFGILDTRTAQKRAMAAAVANGTAAAEAVAAASGVRLGRLLRASDNDTRMVSMDGIGFENMSGGLGRLREPVTIEISPKAVVTNARLVLSFEVIR